MSSSVPTQLVVLRHKIPDPAHPGYVKARHLYGELHDEHVLIGTDREILSSRLKMYLPASPEWVAYATNRKLTFQTRSGWERSFVKRVPYMFDCDGHIMPVFDLEKTELALNYNYFRAVPEPPKPTGPAPAAPVPAPSAPAPAPPAPASARRVSFAPPAQPKRRGRNRSDSTDAVIHGEFE